MGIINEMIRDDAVKEERYEIAKNMLRDGMGVSAISKYTGIPETDVRKLKDEVEAVA